VRLARSTKARLQQLAKSTGRSRAFLAAQAIEEYRNISTSTSGRSPAFSAPSPRPLAVVARPAWKPVLTSDFPVYFFTLITKSR
jgi:hypothetical protein